MLRLHEQANTKTLTLKHFTDLFFFHLSLESKVTVKVSSLPPQTTTDEIEAYFEKQGDHIEVLSTFNLGNGNAQLELFGLTPEGIHNNISHLHCELTVNAIPSKTVLVLPWLQKRL